MISRFQLHILLRELLQSTDVSRYASDGYGEEKEDEG